MELPAMRHKKKETSDFTVDNDSKHVTRREFVQYSTFALVAAVFSASLPGCGGSGGSGGVESESGSEQDQLLSNQTNTSLGSIQQIIQVT